MLYRFVKRYLDIPIVIGRYLHLLVDFFDVDIVCSKNKQRFFHFQFYERYNNIQLNLICTPSITVFKPKIVNRRIDVVNLMVDMHLNVETWLI